MISWLQAIWKRNVNAAKSGHYRILRSRNVEVEGGAVGPQQMPNLEHFSVSVIQNCFESTQLFRLDVL